MRNLTVKVHIRKPGRVAWKYVGRANVVQEFQGSQSRVGASIAHSARPNTFTRRAHRVCSQSSDQSARAKLLLPFQRCATLTGLSEPSHLPPSRNPRMQTSEVQADKRGNFIVVACVESSGVTSWSLNVSRVLLSPSSRYSLLTRGLLVQAINNSDALKLLASIELACYRCKQAILDPSRYSKSRRRIEKVVREDRRRRHTSKKEEEDLVAAFGSQQIAPEDPSLSLPQSNPFLAGATSGNVPAVSTNFLRAFQPSAAVAQ